MGAVNKARGAAPGPGWGRRPQTPLLILVLAPMVAHAQGIDLSKGGPVTVTALGGIDWDQAAKTVTAHDDARAVRGDTTVTADRLIAHYRKKAGAPDNSPPAPAPEAANGAPDTTGSNEIYRLDADQHVHIFNPTDQAWGDHGIYDMDQAVLVLTGQHLKLTTPQDVMTARDTMEYWSQKRMGVGRGDASVTSNDGRRIRGDTLVAYFVDTTQQGAKPGTKPPPPPKPRPEDSGKPTDELAQANKIERVEAFGHVEVRTQTEIITGERGVYVPDTGLARIVGHVHVTRGENELNGAAAIVNMKTGLATLTQNPGSRVEGLVVPNEQQPKSATPEPNEKPNEPKPAARKPEIQQ